MKGKEGKSVKLHECSGLIGNKTLVAKAKFSFATQISRVTRFLKLSMNNPGSLLSHLGIAQSLNVELLLVSNLLFKFDTCGVRLLNKAMPKL